MFSNVINSELGSSMKDELTNGLRGLQEMEINLASSRYDANTQSSVERIV